MTAEMEPVDAAGVGHVDVQLFSLLTRVAFSLRMKQVARLSNASYLARMIHPEHQAAAEEMRAELEYTRERLAFWLHQPRDQVASPSGQTYDFRQQRLAGLRVAIANLEKAIALLEQGPDGRPQKAPIAREKIGSA